jgi:hypothetical protein
MNSMQISFYICLGGFLIFTIAALFVWAIRVHPFIKARGEKSAFFFYNMASLFDYRKARRVSLRIGRKPQFLIWYERLQITAILFFISGIVTLLVSEFRLS